MSGLAIKLVPDIEIRWRQGGERCTPVGRDNSQLLKKLFQEYQLETWLRDRVPLVYADEDLVAIGDLWVCQNFAPQEGEQALILHWQLST